MTETRFTPSLDLDGLSPDEAFAVLGNDIRLDVVRVLWQASAVHMYDDGSESVETMPYSDLRREVDVEDNGKFNYHLSRLTPHFVRKTEQGYRLSGAGKQIARTVIAVSGANKAGFSRSLDQNFPLCGAAMLCEYEDQWLRVRCTECMGLFGDEAPTGTVFLTNYPAAGLRKRSPDEALANALYRCVLDITYMMHGVCRECAGCISGETSVCDNHEHHDGRPCTACGTWFPVWAEMRCDGCRYAKRLPIEMFVLGLTPVISYLNDQGFDALAPSFAEAVQVLQNRFETGFTENPFRASVTIEGRESALKVSLDDGMNVVDLDRPKTDGVAR